MIVSPPPESNLLSYITEDDLRDSLTSDFREMEAAKKAESWKSVQVLAGSIVEALLLDYLLSIKYMGKSEDDISKMDLGAAIAACVTESLLDDTTEKLCCVIRDYRNLIHPGRVKRLQKPATQETAEIAVQLVKMVAREIAKRRREQYGYTAQEVVAKIEGDSAGFPSVLSMLLQKLPQSERKRLLFKILPERNCEWRLQMAVADDPELVTSYRNKIRCVSLCFRQLLRTSGSEIMKEVGKKYLHVLHSGTELERQQYEYSFFRASDIALYPQPDQETLIDHVFSMFDNPSTEALACTEGLGRLLWPGAALAKRLSRIVQVAFHQHQIDTSDIVAWLRGLVGDLNQPVSTAFSKELDGQAGAVSTAGEERVVQRVRAIQTALGPALHTRCRVNGVFG